MKLTRLLAAAVVVLGVALTGCGDSSSPSPNPVVTAPEQTPPAPPTGELKFDVVGNCTSNATVLKANGSGFTPNGDYVTKAWYPDGTAYTAIKNPGRASPSGTTPEWEWDCTTPGANGKPDPPGTYKVELTDVSTNRKVKTTLKVTP